MKPVIVNIIVNEVVRSTVTNADAMPLKILMEKEFNRGNNIILSFKGIDTLTTSFLNSSIGEVVDRYGLDFLKGKLGIKDYTTSIGIAVKKYIEDLKNFQSIS